MRSNTKLMGLMAIALAHSLALADPSKSPAAPQLITPPIFANSFGLGLPEQSPDAREPVSRLQAAELQPATDSFGLNHEPNCQAARKVADRAEKSSVRCIEI